MPFYEDLPCLKDSSKVDPAVFADAFYFVLVSPSPGGVRGKVRIVIFLRRSGAWGPIPAGSGG